MSPASRAPDVLRTLILSGERVGVTVAAASEALPLTRGRINHGLVKVLLVLVIFLCVRASRGIVDRLDMK